MINRNQYS